MVHSVCRHYSSPATLAGYLRRVAAQLARRCRQHLLAPGKLWEQERPALVAALGEVCALHAAFVAQAGPLLNNNGGGGSGGGGGGGGGPKKAAAADLAGPTNAAGAAAAAAPAGGGAAAGAELADAAFARFGQFARRCAKLADMFGTVHQFSQLAQHTHIEGVAGVLQQFDEVRAA
jgi:dynein heavy chain